MSPDRIHACRRCGYAANPNTATHCELCQYPLIAKNTSRRRSPTVPWAAVTLIGLLLGTAILFWLWRNNTLSPATTHKVSPNMTTTVAATQSEATQTSLAAGGLQTYNSLKEVQNVPKGIFNYASA